jgi:hypothetical protein
LNFEFFDDHSIRIPASVLDADAVLVHSLCHQMAICVPFATDAVPRSPSTFRFTLDHIWMIPLPLPPPQYALTIIRFRLRPLPVQIEGGSAERFPVVVIETVTSVV